MLSSLVAMGTIAVVPLLLMLAYLALIIYLVTLASRFVRAIEQIANRFDQIQLPQTDRRQPN